MAAPTSSRGRWVAIVTGALSVAIGVIYLVLITVLDSRGPMLPPPPEALVGVAAASELPVATAPQPVEQRSPKIFPGLNLDD